MGQSAETYRLWCITVCDLENLKNEEAMTSVGSQCHRKKINGTTILKRMSEIGYKDVQWIYQVLGMNGFELF